VSSFLAKQQWSASQIIAGREQLRPVHVYDSPSGTMTDKIYTAMVAATISKVVNRRDRLRALVGCVVDAAL